MQPKALERSVRRAPPWSPASTDLRHFFIISDQTMLSVKTFFENDIEISKIVYQSTDTFDYI